MAAKKSTEPAGEASTDAESAPSFEASLDELDSLVKQLESGDLPLDKALELFERGMALSDACRKQLEQAETRVEILLKKGGKVEPSPMPSSE